MVGSENDSEFARTCWGALRSFHRAFLGETKESGITVSYSTDETTISRLHRDIVGRCFPEGDTGTVEELMDEVKADECAVIVAKENNDIFGGVVVSH